MHPSIHAICFLVWLLALASEVCAQQTTSSESGARSEATRWYGIERQQSYLGASKGLHRQCPLGWAPCSSTACYPLNGAQCCSNGKFCSAGSVCHVEKDGAVDCLKEERQDGTTASQGSVASIARWVSESLRVWG
ncbi:hypothetical protein BD309DRAFT_965703 [Dichomitus squalens]|uniref:Uncharacterized protein n=1 Tax=Dichomitus squalens TaxID=114155 RepID=A0A4Q9PN46_9APHY|nr:hypothetical protein BD309DRAFT_965703 [Dichomitus squalens]TBU55691.1 hypothetical protein BD310DRAFT_933086 [Dichomitus squalens]